MVGDIPGGQVTNARIFSPRVLQSYVTQGNATERIAADSWHSKLPWVTVGDPGLGTKVGTARRHWLHRNMSLENCAGAR